jgi:hypothetical protein
MKTIVLICTSIAYFACTNNLAAQTGSWKLAGNNLAGTEKLGSKNNFDVKFVSNNRVRMTVKADGRIGFGTTNPLARFNFYGLTRIDDSLGTSLLPLLILNGRSNNATIELRTNDTLKTIFGYDQSSNSFNLNVTSPYVSSLAVNRGTGDVLIGNASLPDSKITAYGGTRIVGNLGVQAFPNSRTIQCGVTNGSLLGIGTAEYIQDAGISTLSFNENVVPAADNSWALGSSTNRWTAVWAIDGTINTSDARDKTNVRDLNYGIREIMQLHPVKFNWKNNAGTGDKLGIIAQEIQKVLPEVVRDWEYQSEEKTGKKTKMPSAKLGVMYADIIPVLIRAIQEQQKQIDDLKQLVSQVSSVQINPGASSDMIVLSNTSLGQNVPNPVRRTTTIRYNADRNAQINITDEKGKLIKQIQLDKGTGILNLDCSSLAAGPYNYSLVAEGKIIDSRKMIVVK